jgi:hypothetical protein
MFTDLDAIFPNLAISGYRRRSDCTTRYNCLAWALGDDSKWWEPDPYDLLYWPPDIPRNYAVRNYIEVCKKHGYQRCRDGKPEAGYEKLVIFTERHEFRHIARQRENGIWTSKLGPLEDIDHNNIDAFDGSSYGRPTIFLKRKINP